MILFHAHHPSTALLANSQLLYLGMSSYDPITDSYIISEEYKDFLTSVYKSTVFYSFFIGSSILMFLAFLALSTKIQRRTCLFYLLSATFVMLLITAISTLVKENQVRQDIFTKSLDEALAAWRIRQSESCLSNRHDRSSHALLALKGSAALLLMERVTCFMADMALICKLRSFYPRPAYSNRQRLLRVAPLLLLIPPRLIAIALLPATFIMQKHQLGLRMNITEYCFQISWCTFATGECAFPSAYCHT